MSALGWGVGALELRPPLLSLCRAGPTDRGPATGRLDLSGTTRSVPSRTRRNLKSDRVAGLPSISLDACGGAERQILPCTIETTALCSLSKRSRAFAKITISNVLELVIGPLRAVQELESRHVMSLRVNPAMLSVQQLLCQTSAAVVSQREVTAKVVAYLAEVGELRLHLRAGYSSLYEFCVKRLRLSTGEAFRRILASRLVKRFAIIQSLIASGAIHLSALELMRERLTDENHGELLDAASGKSKQELEAWLAARFPRPDAPSKIEKL